MSAYCAGRQYCAALCSPGGAVRVRAATRRAEANSQSDKRDFVGRDQGDFVGRDNGPIALVLGNKGGSEALYRSQIAKAPVRQGGIRKSEAGARGQGVDR